MSKVEIRSTKPGDGTAVEAFLEAHNELKEVNESLTGLAQVIDAPPEHNFFSILALENDKIVGALIAGPAVELVKANAKLPKAGRDALTDYITEIGYIVVAPEARGRNIGTSLLLRAEHEIAKKNSLVILFFNPATPGLADFYEKNNYTLIPHGNGISVQPPVIAPPVGIMPTDQIAYKTLKPHLFVRVYSNAHVVHGVFDG